LIKSDGVGVPQFGQANLLSAGMYDRPHAGQMIGLGATGTSLITSRVSVTVRVPPPPTKKIGLITPPPL
jgi:hypothetical protein